MKRQRRHIAGDFDISLRKVPDASDMLDEAEVERRFHLTASKLRVAQRLGLIESSLGVRGDGKYVRAWDRVQIARAFIANAITSYTTIPFQAACDIIKEVERVSGIKIGAGMSAGRKAKTRSATLHLYDKCVVSYELNGDGEKIIGHLHTREDGRTTFIPGTPEIPSPWLTKGCFNGQEARSRFLKAAQSA